MSMRPADLLSKKPRRAQQIMNKVQPDKKVGISRKATCHSTA